MSNSFKVESCLICDLARKELGGKDTLVGVYAGSMVSNEIPATLPCFAVWVQVLAEKKEYQSMVLEIIRPEGTLLMKGEGSIVFSNIKQPIGIPFQFPTLTFPTEGVYKIRFGLDSEPKEIGEFILEKGSGE